MRTIVGYVIYPCLLALVVTLGLVHRSFALNDDHLMGAQKALKAIEKASESAGDENNRSSKDSKELLLQNLEQYRKNKKQMPAQKVVDEWLSLFDRFWSLPPAKRAMIYDYSYTPDKNSVSFVKIMSVIPGPEDWALLQNRVDKRPVSIRTPLADKALAVIVHFLNGDIGPAGNEIDDMASKTADLDQERQAPVAEALSELRVYLNRVLRKGDAQAIIKDFKMELAYKKQINSQECTITIPDLCNLTNEADARALIEEAFAIPNSVLTIPAEGQTLALVKKICLEKLQEIDRPQWQLITALDDINLFEKMDQKFGHRNNAVVEPDRLRFSSGKFQPAEWNDENGDLLQARLVYIFGLAAADRTEDAVTFTLSLPPESLVSYTILRAWRDTGATRFDSKLFTYCARVLDQAPEMPLWSLFTTLALSTGRTEELLQQLEAPAPPGNPIDKKRMNKEQARIKAYLAVDKTDKAIEVIRKSAGMPDEQMPQSLLANFIELKKDLGIKLAGIGRLLNRSELMDEGINMVMGADRAAEQITPQEAYHYFSDTPGKICDLLTERKRFSDAEQYIISRMGKIISRLKTKEQQACFGYDTPYSGYLSLLARLYEQTGRHNDVLLLLEQAPWWGRQDLLDIDDPELCLAAAKSLHAVGRTDEAIAIVKYQLYNHPGADDIYSFLVTATGPGVMPWLDELYERDHFEERPLIWKASLLLKAGDLALAEKTIRQALKIDPTDGEQKAGDRVRAYAVLADILEAAGKSEDALFFRNVVESVRIAEQGDAFKDLDMIQQSLDRYAKAQILFGDAYCVQWRLAERLYETGQYDEAKKHYEIAFERMPEQFGQVASFCFGCEGVFDKPHSRSIAETVLLRLEKSHADRPQVHFLLGQLRDAEMNYNQAYRHFKNAVGLDPQYLDAWKEIISLKDKVFLSQSESDAIILTMLKMDPLMKHFNAELDRMVDLKDLWQVLEGNKRYQLEPPESLLSLTASKSAIETFGKNMELVAPDQWAYIRRLSESQLYKVQDPGQVLAQHFLVKGLDHILQMVYGNY